LAKGELPKVTGASYSQPSTAGSVTHPPVHWSVARFERFIPGTQTRTAVEKSTDGFYDH
jgi:hypothetical protein